MDDWWLFIASLAASGSFGVWVVRYFVRQHGRLLKDHRQPRECLKRLGLWVTGARKRGVRAGGPAPMGGVSRRGRVS